MTVAAPARTSTVRGALFIVLAFACVAAMSALGKAAGGVPTAMIVFFQSALIGWVGWHDTPGLLAALGALLVTAGGILSMTLGGDTARMHHGSTGDTTHFFNREVAK